MESPLMGVGFGVAKGYSERWELSFESGISREKMNSYLALVEEVGIVGSVFLLLPTLWVLAAGVYRLMLLRRFYPSANEFWTVLTLSSSLVGGLASASGEAWLTAAGFFSAVMYWLVFGILAARLTIPLRSPQ
jgi:hypothetical protein